MDFIYELETELEQQLELLGGCELLRGYLEAEILKCQQ
jgi:hypothetical protein